MRIEDIIRVREQAEKAVTGMPEGPMKTKAFEVVLERLLDRLVGDAAPVKTVKNRGAAKRASTQANAAPTSVPGRIISLRDTGFFKEQRSISDVRAALRVHGWHYPLTTLSGRLVELVQRGMLRRELVKEGTKKIWKYSNP